MRFDSKYRPVRGSRRLGALAGVLFASGSGVSASGQAPAPPSAPPAADATAHGPQRRRSPDAGPEHAVKISLGRSGEDGAREQPRDPRRAADPADPDLRRRPGARRCTRRACSRRRPTRSSTTPPGNFLTGTGSTLTNDSFRTNAGLQQLRAVGRRPLHGLTGTPRKLTTSDASSRFNPQLDSGLTARYTQPLLRNFKIDSARQNAAAQPEAQQVADIAAAADADADVARGPQRLLRSGERDRRARGRAAVARARADVAQEQPAPRRGRHDGADRHRRRRRRRSRATRKR